ncbi:hypothetical protein D9M68_297930 [compost metagenome]
MEKAQFPLLAELSLADTENFTASEQPRKFAGTDNPRHLRVICALMVRSRRREEIDRIAGASNGPDLIAELRRRGLETPCQRVPAVDRDGSIVRPGVYSFAPDDVKAIHTWQRKRAKGAA